MRLKFKLRDGSHKILDLDSRATVEEVIKAVGSANGDFSFGNPPKALSEYKTKTLATTPLKEGDVLWEVTASSSSVGLETQKFREVIVIEDDEEEETSAKLSSAPQEDETSSKKRSRRSLLNPPLFLQNPVQELGIPETERNVTTSLWSLVQGGEHLKEAIILNYCVDLENIMKRLFPQLRKVPVALCCADGSGITKESFDDCFPEFGSRLIHPKCPPYGTHHSKMFVLFYGDRGIRVIVHTSNLEITNLFMHTEGTWYQDFPPKNRSGVSNSAVASGAGNDFEKYLARVLVSSGIREASMLLSKYDFSTAEVALVATVPKESGTAFATASEISQNGLGRVQYLLQRERQLNPTWAATIKNWPVVLQGSSLGSQASRVSSTANWLIDELGKALGARNAAQVELVVVSRQEMENSHFGIEGAQATFFKREHFQMPEVKQILRKWTPSHANLPTRSLLLPHFKSYICYNPDNGRDIAWAIIGSHNCTKAAWGSWTSSTRDKLMCLSYELSVMFLPSLLKSAGTKRWSIIENAWIEIADRTILVADSIIAHNTEALLPIPFKLPTTPYDFLVDQPYFRED